MYLNWLVYGSPRLTEVVRGSVEQLWRGSKGWSGWDGITRVAGDGQNLEVKDEVR